MRPLVLTMTGRSGQRGLLRSNSIVRRVSPRIAEEFGLSRPPVRELMRQIAAEGYIELEANHAALSASMTGSQRIGKLTEFAI